LKELVRSYLTISKDLTRVMNRVKALYRKSGQSGSLKVLNKTATRHPGNVVLPQKGNPPWLPHGKSFAMGSSPALLADPPL
jgi:hypothetical protein